MSDPSHIITERDGRHWVERDARVPLEAILDALKSSGVVLKVSRKSVTRRVGEWAVKQSRPTAPVMLKHALHPARYRQGWRAALRLAPLGNLVPTPRAYVEFRCGRLLLGNALICDYLDGWKNVEAYARILAASNASRDTVNQFLEALAGSVNALNAAGAYHTDLSGKNIFTRQGDEFRFIDLDGVVLDGPYTDEQRLKNHVQLYDSFCDLWGEGFLGPFLTVMYPGGASQGWLESVKKAQSLRRARTLALWSKQRRSTVVEE